MARRGEALREHILDTAKLAFLETGFERTSMDAIAARAETSKRSLYAHFPTKDALFHAVVDRVRTLFADRIGTPADYAEQPAEAIVRYCGRFVQLLRWSSVGRMVRLGIGEADRLPELAAGLFDVLFGVTTGNLAADLVTAFGLPDGEAASVADELVGVAIHPTLPRLLFGIEPLTDELPSRADLASEVDLDRIRRLLHRVLPV
ncbi:TetR/AcrR family transcriptional regulator [Amycolatopsis sp. SID8362]|uniref:TetR/AcrR family transcriptional regulator n=1 Tax=Amycolatopsis sp. SID8362 TaxID=2690346 RepID=UPI0013694B12|nr:TetR/AcrR family transcriptional regulator [Amycolatopsis sp. SID8362]NBH05994.1 TetR family transcriptional regulator [Amycolatopsis sp. SID8362]NED42692.1 TetR/AcrR family transcriptional regulator [Amycolatopsis sp. SID8362]